MTREIFVASDHHFGHENIIGYCNRPFPNVDEMNEAMVERHNSVVRDEDIVYFLGDVYFGKRGKGFLRRLRGRKRLVLGNHDDAKDSEIADNFQKILAWRMFPEFGLLLTHVPVYRGIFLDEHSEERQGKFDLNVHGHLHNKSVMMIKPRTKKTIIEDPRYRCVSVEHINYTPINVEELRTRWKKTT